MVRRADVAPPLLGGEGRGEGGRKQHLSLSLLHLFSLSLLALLFLLLAPSAQAVPQYLGDLNEDNQVDVRDLQILLNHLSALQGRTNGAPRLLPHPLSFFADVNQDGFQNQSDVDALRDIILGRQPIVFFPLDMVIETSPAHGESGVAVTRETILRFSQPLAPSTVLTTNHLCACFGGRQILSRIDLSSDRRKVTLFYQEPLPASARVRVTFNSEGLQDFVGRPLDPDGDGVGGGVKLIDFDTLSITPVTNTEVQGYIFASVQVPVVSANTTTNFMDHPLEHVRITVDGAEDARFGQPRIETFTDAQGFFRLTNCPAGKFFVTIDGHTSRESNFPLGNYYAKVGKPWETVAGRTNLPGTGPAANRGPIYLPLVQAGTLQTVNPIADTTIGFPSNIIAANSAWAGVSVTIPTNALFSDNGTRGGRVGLAPVPADRLPERLPAGIVHALDISIQTDGPQNVDRPLPVRFPNLPDPQTGLKLPPGAKSALMSYNHDTGRWEVQGPMTVSADGNYVETDPGVGVRQPGWHGTMGGTQGGGGPMTGPGTGPGPYNDDIDGDGIPNGQDDDVDGDGVGNGDDPDIDGDGIPNNQDSDMDGDGIPNNQDDDQDGDGIPNDQDPDPDGEDPECSVSITGSTQGTVGETLTLSSSVSPAGGTYGWSVVGSGASFASGQNGNSAQLNLLAEGTVTVHLTYRPPGVNNADGQCSATSTVTISPPPPTIAIIYPADGDSFTTSSGIRLNGLTFVARLNPEPAPGTVINWEFRDLAYAPFGTVATAQGLRVTPSIPVRNPPGPVIPDGRGVALSFQATVSVTIDGQNYSNSIILTQDATDQMRQQFVDLDRQRPPKNRFSGAAIPLYPSINNAFASALPLYKATATTRLTDKKNELEAIPANQRTPVQQQQLQAVDANLQAVQTLSSLGPVFSSYRSPYQNATEPNSVPNSLHQYGLAADFGPVLRLLAVLDDNTANWNSYATDLQTIEGILEDRSRITPSPSYPGASVNRFDVYPKSNSLHIEHDVNGLVNRTHSGTGGTCDLNGSAPNPPSP